jgi:hypothetical protein
MFVVITNVDFCFPAAYNSLVIAIYDIYTAAIVNYSIK